MSLFDDLLKDLEPFGPTPEEREREEALADLSQYDHALHNVDFGNDIYDDPDDEWTETSHENAADARQLHVGLAGGANCFSSALIADDDLTGAVRPTWQHTIALDLDFPCQVVSGGGKTIVSLDYRTAGLQPEHPGFLNLVATLYTLGILSHEYQDGNVVLGGSPRGIWFETPHRARWVESSTPGHGHLYIDAILWWDEYEALLESFAWAGLVEPGYVAASKRRRATHLRLPWVSKVEPDAEPDPF